MANGLTHEDLRVAAIAFAKRYKYVPNIGYDGLGLTIIASETMTFASDIPDVLGWKMGWSCLIECKSSRSDFFADAKKPQRENGTGMGERRYFFVPKGLITLDELPKDWGLIEFADKKTEVTVQAKRRELDIEAQREEKQILMSLLRRVKCRQFLIIQDERTE